MLSHISAKILTPATLPATIAKWRLLHQSIVFTNGCFDLLHYGHLHYLAEAKTLGNRLIIGVNSKRSVSQLKGKHRPINDDLTRFHLLAALAFVDAVIEFDELTPLALIEQIQPDVLVKGGDWRPEQIVGAEVVLAKGGIVKSLPFVEGYSTTNIEQKIKGA
ncbi:MAG: D-glycero-beta-D-manno-heptose 1-phosphate adenylyltransferase [Bacteroidota bacterium]